MARMKICTYPQKVLMEKAQPIAEIDDAIKKIAEDMIETMYIEHGVGLAANQVGLLCRIFVMDVSEKQDEPQICINPEILQTFGETTCPHGCLSLPGVPGGDTPRAEELMVRYTDLDGNTIEKKIDGLEARCFQHEIDHLNGKLYVHRLSKLKRDRLLKKYRREN